jgi:glutamate 5-kinase
MDGGANGMTLWVVKLGTSLLRGDTAATIEGYASGLAAAMRRGDQVVLVTSGAVGLGCQKLHLPKRPDTVVALQAAAATGQGYLMALYERAMAVHGLSVAQVLLTRSDLVDRRRYQNASGTLQQLLAWGVLPVINENDALSSAELRFGDNDTLSALVAAAVGAHQLLLLNGC